MSKTNREKARNTCLEKYGNEFYNNRGKCSETLLSRNEKEKENWRTKVREKWKRKSEEEKKEIFKKRKESILKKYGTTKIYIQKTLEKYGVKNISQVPWISEKIKQTKKNKTEEEIKFITEKQVKTFLKNYGVSHNMLVPEIKEKVIRKGRETKIKNGTWLPDEKISLFNLYRRKVYFFTQKSIKDKFSAEELSKTGRCGVKDSFQADHTFSIKDGFLSNIPPYIIGHKCNLQLIPWDENDKKKNKSWITKEQLFRLFEETK